MLRGWWSDDSIYQAGKSWSCHLRVSYSPVTLSSTCCLTCLRKCLFICKNWDGFLTNQQKWKFTRFNIYLLHEDEQIFSVYLSHTDYKYLIKFFPDSGRQGMTFFLCEYMYYRGRMSTLCDLTITVTVELICTTTSLGLLISHKYVMSASIIAS